MRFVYFSLVTLVTANVAACSSNDSAKEQLTDTKDNDIKEEQLADTKDNDIKEEQLADTKDNDIKVKPPVELLKCEEPIEGSHKKAKEKYWPCSLDAPCKPAVLRAMEKAGDLKWDEADAATCVINAFKAGKPASLKLEKDVAGGQYTYDIHLTILGPGKAVALLFNTQDDSYEVEIRRRQIIKDAAYFDECAAATSDEAMYDCLADWSDGCHDEPDVCPQ